MSGGSPTSSLPRGFGGYDTKQVDRVLADYAAWCDEAERESAELLRRADELELRRRESDLEQLLSAALASSRRAAEEVTERARSEHAEKLEEARRRAEQAGRRAAAERAVAEEAIKRLRAARAERTASFRATLRAVLARLEASGEDGSSPGDDLNRSK